MKKYYLLAAVIAALLLATGCQKETFADWQANMVMPSETLNVVYTVDRTTYSALFGNELEWLAFLDRLFALAEEGRSVSFRDAGSPVNAKQNREVVTYTTRDKSDAEKWADVMQKKGYPLTVFTYAGAYSSRKMRFHSRSMCLTNTRSSSSLGLG